MQLTTDHSCTCLICDKIFGRRAGETEAATLLCGNCWQGMMRWYNRLAPGLRFMNPQPDHVHAFVTYHFAKKNATNQKADPRAPGDRVAEPAPA